MYVVVLNLQETSSEDEPHRLVHTVTKPIIQEVHEVISPFRKVIQEIRPLQEEVSSMPFFPSLTHTHKFHLLLYVCLYRVRISLIVYRYKRSWHEQTIRRQYFMVEPDIMRLGHKIPLSRNNNWSFNEFNIINSSSSSNNNTTTNNWIITNYNNSSSNKSMT